MPAVLTHDELRGQPGARLRGALHDAAALRDALRSWEEVARVVGRPYASVTKWPQRYPARWAHYSEQARLKREEATAALTQRYAQTALEGGVEALVLMRSFSRGLLPPAKDGSRGDTDADDQLLVSASVRQAAAHSLLLAAQKQIGERTEVRFEDVTPHSDPLEGLTGAPLRQKVKAMLAAVLDRERDDDEEAVRLLEAAGGEG